MKQCKKLLALLLALAMTVGMTACGSKEGSTQNAGTSGGGTQTPTVAESLGYGYVADYKTLGVELNWINTTSVAGETMYFSGDYYNEKTGESGNKFYGVNAADGSVTEIPLPELTSTDTVQESVHSVRVCADGSGYYLVTSSFEYSGDLGAEPMPIPYTDEETEAGAETEAEVQEAEPAPAPQARDGEISEEAESPEDTATPEETAETADTDDTAAIEGEGEYAIMPISDDVLPDSSVEAPVEYTESRTWYTIYQCDMDGNVRNTIDLSQVNEDTEYFYVNNVVAAGNGDLLISCDTRILRFGADGTRKEDISLGDNAYVDNMAVSENGTVLVTSYGENGQVIYKIGADGTATELPLVGEVSDWGYSLFPGVGGDVLLSDGKQLYHLNTDTGELQAILNWLDSDINGSRISGVAACGEDRIMVLLYNWSSRGGEPSYELGVLTKTPLEEIPQKITLTMGALYLDSDYTDTVIDFNRTNGTYRISLIDYSTYNTDEDYTLGQKQLDLDVVSGNAPDIISLSSGNAQKYIGKGVLANLRDFLDKDSEIGMEDLVPGALTAYQREEALYGIPTSFSLQSLCASSELVGDATSWSMDDLYAVIQKLPADTEIMSYYTQNDFLDMMLTVNLSSYVDYDKATCSFDTDGFKRLLEIAAKFPAEYQMEDDAVWMDDMQKMQLGLTLMSGTYIASASDLKRYYGLYTPENGLVSIGYPTDTGNGVVISLDGGLAISASCKNPEGAWAFLKMMLSEDSQKNLVWSFPVRKTAFEEMLKAAMEKDYYLDENNEKVYYESTEYIGDKEFTIPVLTEAQLAEFKELVNGATVSGTYDQSLLEIIREEAAAYFAGDKSADETAALIQNRVSIYLGENS